MRERERERERERDAIKKVGRTNEGMRERETERVVVNVLLNLKK